MHTDGSGQPGRLYIYVLQCQELGIYIFGTLLSGLEQMMLSSTPSFHPIAAHAAEILSEVRLDILPIYFIGKICSELFE